MLSCTSMFPAKHLIPRTCSMSCTMRWWTILLTGLTRLLLYHWDIMSVKPTKNEKTPMRKTIKFYVWWMSELLFHQTDFLLCGCTGLLCNMWMSLIVKLNWIDNILFWPLDSEKCTRRGVEEETLADCTMQIVHLIRIVVGNAINSSTVVNPSIKDRCFLWLDLFSIPWPCCIY